MIRRKYRNILFSIVTSKKKSLRHYAKLKEKIIRSKYLLKVTKNVKNYVQVIIIIHPMHDGNDIHLFEDNIIQYLDVGESCAFLGIRESVQLVVQVKQTPL